MDKDLSNKLDNIKFDKNFDIENKIIQSLHVNNKQPRDSFKKIFPKKNDLIDDKKVILIRPKITKYAYLSRYDGVLYNYKNYYILSIDRNNTKDSIKIVLLPWV